MLRDDDYTSWARAKDECLKLDIELKANPHSKESLAVVTDEGESVLYEAQLDDYAGCAFSVVRNASQTIFN